MKSNQAHGKDQGIEQVGSWDPFPNREHGEQLVGLNVERILYWIGQGAEPTKRAAEILGLAGILPIHPHSLLIAHRTRVAIAERESKETVDVEASNKEGEQGEENAEEDVLKRSDAIWRKKTAREHWWRHGLM